MVTQFLDLLKKSCYTETGSWFYCGYLIQLKYQQNRQVRMKNVMQILALSGVLSALLVGCGGSGNSDSSGSHDDAPTKPKTDHVTTPTTSGKVADEWVKAHNKYRRMHQVGDVKWSADIAKDAQAYADTCPKTHSDPSGEYRDGRGENLAWGGGYFGDNFTKVVDYWYSEVSEHDYKSNDWRGGITGHFTQVVWKNTTEIGCGYNSSCGVYVCQYNPAGNNGQYTKNVFPPK